MKKNYKDDIIDISYDDDEKDKVKLLSSKYFKYVLVVLFLIILIFLVNILFFNNKGTTYVIRLTGDKNINILLGEEYVEPGYIAFDNKNNNVTDQVRIVNTINTSQVGDYEVVYIIGNKIVRRNVSVIENIDGSTSIYLKGDKVKYIEVGKKYEESGYIAIDTVDGDITEKVKVEGEVDTDNTGIYKIVYSVTNSNNITTMESRTVVVSKYSLNLNILNDGYTKDKVIIEVGVIDKDFSYLELPNKERIYEKTYRYTVSENGTYEFSKYNKDGDKQTESIKVNNIDRELPNGTCEGVIRGSKTTISVKATDNTGISYYKYMEVIIIQIHLQSMIDYHL